MNNEKIKPEDLNQCLIEERWSGNNSGGITTINAVECKGGKVQVLLYSGCVTQIFCPHLNRTTGIAMTGFNGLHCSKPDPDSNAQTKKVVENQEQIQFVRDIIKRYLKTNGYDGLYNDGNCGCTVEDLVPCCGSCADCEPGYRVNPPDSHEESPFWISPKKEQ